MVLLVATAVALSFVLPIKNYLNGAATWIRAHDIVGGIVWVLVFSVWQLLCLPSFILEVSSGYIFGFGWGFAVAMISSIVSAAGSFFIVAKYGSDEVGRGLSACRLQRALRVFEALGTTVRRKGWRMVFLIQMAYIPGCIKNYGLAILDVELTQIIWTKAVTSAFFVSVTVYAGSTAADLVETITSGGQLTSTKIIVLVVGTVCLVAVLVSVGYFVKREMDGMVASVEADQENDMSGSLNQITLTDVKDEDVLEPGQVDVLRHESCLASSASSAI
jgi:uncharacterized membrane protein YdjX (TVP38/TMEM64 family)